MGGDTHASHLESSISKLVVPAGTYKVMGAFQFQYDYYERMDDLAVGDLIVVPSDVFKDNVSNGKFKASEKRLELSKFLQHCRPILRMGSHLLTRFLNVSNQASP
eukprot:950056_1